MDERLVAVYCSMENMVIGHLAVPMGVRVLLTPAEVINRWKESKEEYRMLRTHIPPQGYLPCPRCHAPLEIEGDSNFERKPTGPGVNLKTTRDEVRENLASGEKARGVKFIHSHGGTRPRIVLGKTAVSVKA